MSIVEEKAKEEQPKISDANAKILSNFFRFLTSLERTLERLARQRWYSEKQYSEIYFEIISAILFLRTWAEDYKIYSGLEIFQNFLTNFITGVADQISILIETSHHSPGKKKDSKTLRQRQQAEIQRSIKKMIDHLIIFSGELKEPDTLINQEIKIALAESFEKSLLKAQENHHRKVKLSQRGEKSFIFPWDDPQKYHALVEDKNRFRSDVVEKLKNFQHDTGHKPNCKCRGIYKMKGFRKKPRKTVMPGGHKEEFRIRMVECSDCGQRFSLLPSFIPREKHFSIDMIGIVLRGIVLFSQSLNGALENSEMCGRKIKSRQTLLNWIQWAGQLHPATLLVRCGAECQGYFQEDEGFEKEPGLRTYTVVMSDPETQFLAHGLCRSCR